MLLRAAFFSACLAQREKSGSGRVDAVRKSVTIISEVMIGTWTICLQGTSCSQSILESDQAFGERSIQHSDKLFP